MIAVNMHEAKSRLSELVKVVETTGEAVVLCRNGDAVAEIRPLARRRLDRCRIKPRSGLKVTMVVVRQAKRGSEQQSVEFHGRFISKISRTTAYSM